MSENTQEKAVKVTTTFGEVLSAIEPAAVRDMIVAGLDEHLSLVKAQNERVYAIRDAKNSDPENVEYQDNTWRRIVSENADPKIVAMEKKYQRLLDEAEKILLGFDDKDGKRVPGLRELSKEFMRPALSEDEIKAKRKEYNDAREAISTSAISAGTFAGMADGMFRAMNPEYAGSVIEFMPAVENLLNTRGKKSSGGNGGGRVEGGYATRIGSATIDGENVDKNGKVSFGILADKLSARFNAKTFPGNEVTATELEEAFYDAAKLSFRDKDNVPETLEFKFEKSVEKQNPTDDGTTAAPEIVTIGFVKWTPAPKDDAAAETATDANSGEGDNAPDAAANSTDGEPAPAE